MIIGVFAANEKNRPMLTNFDGAIGQNWANFTIQQKYLQYFERKLEKRQHLDF